MKENQSFDRRFDVLVIGSGIAGLSAAVAAAETGAKVAVLERSAPEEFGGNTRWTESYFRMKNEQEVSDDFEELLVTNAGHHIDPNVITAMAQDYSQWPGYVKAHGMPDPELVSTLSNQAGPTVQWLKRWGVRFAALPTYFVTAAAPRLMPVGGGLALIEALQSQARRLSVALYFETTAHQLTRRDSQGFLQVGVVSQDGHSHLMVARSVVIASGGFQGNPEMMAHYIGPTSRYIRPVARGGYYNKGEGIRLALALGAAPAGDFSSFHAEPLDPRSPLPEALVMNFPYGILINRQGKRFVDEAPGPIDVNYDHISRAIKDQPDGICWVVFDQSIADVPNWRRSIRTDQPPMQAESIAELAALMEVDQPGLQQTVAEYNASCSGGEFKPLSIDGLATQGLEQRKSNWARPISRGPFMAYPIIAGICFTYGGIKTNSSAQVIDSDGRTVPGLYAAGEATGLYYQVYTGATSVLRGAVFGKIAGEDASKQARDAHL
jgi:tricarballylate dehydrogenase